MELVIKPGTLQSPGQCSNCSAALPNYSVIFAELIYRKVDNSSESVTFAQVTGHDMRMHIITNDICEKYFVFDLFLLLQFQLKLLEMLM